MKVLVEGRISRSNVYKACLLGKEDVTLLPEIVNKGLEIIKHNPNSHPFIKEFADKTTVMDFLKRVLTGEYDEFFVLVFYGEDDDLSGVSLVSRGRPWYAPEGVMFFNEECSVSFKRGLGLSRATAYVLEYLAGVDVQLIAFSNANTLSNKMIENTFEKHLGYSSYKTFYKIF